MTGKSVGKPGQTLSPTKSIPEAYHREIGREATAAEAADGRGEKAYHREIGREATANIVRMTPSTRAYHREIGREATAIPIIAFEHPQAYHREIGREATAGSETAIAPAKPTTGKSVGKPRLNRTVQGAFV